jgi:uncharacterized repeat protein (TIGR03803 family)
MSNGRHGLMLRSIGLAAMLYFGTQSLPAQTYHVLYNLVGSSQASVTMDSAGNLYGTTDGGGLGYGAVFELARVSSRGWFFNTIYEFAGPPQDSSEPLAKLTIGPDGSLYGSTSTGGNSPCSAGYGCGTVFKLTPPASPRGTWTETVLHDFQGQPDDGFYPWGDLTLDRSGNIYGATVWGGSGGGGEGFGTVYNLMPSNGRWYERLLYSFPPYDGSPWLSGVVFDQQGNLYGTASGDGYVPGYVFELIPLGVEWKQTLIYTFSGGSDGGFPAGTLLRDGSGDLYGGATQDGAYGYGVVYELAPTVDGFSFNVVYSFTACCGTGEALSMDASGSLYDTTSLGGAYGKGSIFKLTPSNGAWVYTDLHDFTGGSDGGTPFSSVTIDANGNLYGTTASGGAYNQGVVWEITP